MAGCYVAQRGEADFTDLYNHFVKTSSVDSGHSFCKRVHVPYLSNTGNQVGIQPLDSLL